ncbi:TetR/AcrR family transcriptional regulator [Parasphingorhabdus cellanae]|uniref:TetR/AcrR family transcriptional regulator n=1 Tax=Parasphingorhabdus cellanae TaxID=2806553 RepID=A0ABX7T780_9SPHN|nr:TetR/AcrR family transcriptional regulator [Parasphingorhabdus cellanae]QTD57456.1 TetR/AcrR family transcriptional regulator [Parasphingorhabdus cellanae]
MNEQSPIKQRRYSPEKRKSLILDHTANIVAREGVAMATMDRIGREAGISKSLVYTYFDNQTDLLRVLLKRELKRLRKLQAKEAREAETFEGLVRGVTHQYLKYIEERGLLIERLQAEPSVSDGHDPTDYSRDDAVDYIADIVVDNFNLPRTLAKTVIDISFGLPATAGAHFLRSDESRQEIEDITVTMILGSLNAIENDFAKRQRPLIRQKPEAGTKAEE